MREIQFFGLNQWDEMREFVIKLAADRNVSNIAIYVDASTNSYAVEWDEELIDLENK